MTERKAVYEVFAQFDGNIGHDRLAVYFIKERAQRFINSQDAQLQPNLVVREVVLDADPSDPYWNASRGMAAAFHILAALPDDAVPDDRGTAAKPEVISDDQGGPGP